MTQIVEKKIEERSAQHEKSLPNTLCTTSQTTVQKRSRKVVRLRDQGGLLYSMFMT